MSRESNRSILTIALTGGLLLALAHWREWDALAGDGRLYLSGARNLARGCGFVTNGGEALFVFSPIYPLMIVPALRWMGDVLAAGHLIGFLIGAGALAIWAVVLLRLSSSFDLEAGGSRRSGLQPDSSDHSLKDPHHHRFEESGCKPDPRPEGTNSPWHGSAILVLFLTLANGAWIGGLARVGPEGLLMLGLGAAAWCWLRLEEWPDLKGPRPVLLAALLGAMIALAYVSRPDGLIYGALMGLGWIGRRGRFHSPKAWGLLALGGVTALLAASPYLSYIHRETGVWQLSPKVAHNFRIGNHYNTDRVEHERISYGVGSRNEPENGSAGTVDPRGAGAAAPSSPWDIAARCAVNGALVLDGLQDIFGGPAGVILLGCGGCVLFPRRRRGGPGPRPHWGILLLGPLALLPFHIEERYLLPVIPLLGLVAARGGIGAWRMAASPRLGPRWGGIARVAVAVLLGIFVYRSILREAFRKPPRSSRPFQEMAAWVRAAGLPAGLVASRKSVLEFYLDWPESIIPYTDNHDDLLEVLRRRGAAYVLIDADQIRRKRPEQLYLLQWDAPPAGLIPLHRVLTDPSGKRDLFLYRLQ